MRRNYDEKEAFSFYQDFDELMEYVNSNWDKVPNSYSSKTKSGIDKPDKKWVGSNDLKLLNSKITEFIDPTSLDKIIAEIKELFSTINLGGAFDKDRMVATDLPIGVFDFSLASAGLFRPQEYYCKELDMVVNPNYVRKVSENPSVYVYTDNSSGVSITYSLVQQQEGTHALKEKEAYKDSLIVIGKSESEANRLATEKFPNAKLVFRTKTRKTNLIRRSKLLKENEAGNEKYVDLFINIGGLSDQTPMSLMYASMPCFLVSFFLDRAGIKTRILGLINGAVSGFSQSNDYTNERFMTSFVIKNYEDSFDFNLTAILTADSRIFRYKLFKHIVVEYYNKFRKDIGVGLGSKYYSTAFDLGFERYKNYYIKNADGVGVKNKNTRLMFSSSYIPNPKKSQKAMLDGAIEEFFRIIDAIDIEFNGAAVALPRIKKRELNRGVDIASLRLRLISTIKMGAQFDESDSVYATSPNDIKKRKQLETKLIEDINSNFKNA